MNKFTKFLVGAVAALALVVGAQTAHAAYTQTTTLKMGMSSSQVMSLQQTLNANGFIVATTGNGSPGMESMFFGAKTKAAVMAFQTAHGLKADGVVGPMTGGILATLTGSTTTQALCPNGMTLASNCMSAPTSVPTGALCPNGMTIASNCSSTSGSSTGSGSTTLSGETSISHIRVDNADDDTIDEGATKAPVAKIRFDVDDAAAQLSRVDVIFDGSSNTETKPWRAFDKVYLLDSSSNVIASMDSSNQSDWQEVTANNTYRIRFSGINKNFGIGNDQQLWVAVDVADGINGVDSSSADWNVYVASDATGTAPSFSTVSADGLRFTDGANVDTQVGPGNDSASFTLQQSGGDSNFVVTKDDSSPNASSLEVKANTSSTQTIGVFKLKSDSDGGNVKLDDFPVTLTLGNTSGKHMSDIVDDVYVTIGGKTYTSDTTASTSLTTQTFTFNDIQDDNNVIDAGDSTTATVKVQFKSQGTSQANYANGVTVQAATALAYNNDSVEDANSGDNLASGNVSGSATADVFTLFSDGVSVVLSDSGLDPQTTTDTNGKKTNNTYNLSFKVTSFGNDVYIPKTVARGTTSSTAGLTYVAENSDGTTNTTVGASAGSLQSSADVVTVGGTDYYRVSEDETETFNVSISLTANSTSPGTGASAFYHVQLNDLGFQLTPTSSPSVTENPLNPANDFDTNDGQLQA